MSITTDDIINYFNYRDSKSKRNAKKSLCSICCKKTQICDKYLTCKSCQDKSHIGCNNISVSEYDNVLLSDDSWFCLKCKPISITYLSQIAITKNLL